MNPQNTRMLSNTSTSIACGSSLNNILHPEDGLVVLQFSPNMVPQLGCSEAWINVIVVFWLWHMFVEPCPCIHKICGMGDNTYMACHLSYNNIHQPEGSMVVLQFSTHLVTWLRCSDTWMNRIIVNWLCFRLVRPCLCTHIICGMGGNTSMACCSLCNNIHQPEDGFVVHSLGALRLGWMVF